MTDKGKRRARGSIPSSVSHGCEARPEPLQIQAGCMQTPVPSFKEIFFFFFFKKKKKKKKKKSLSQTPTYRKIRSDLPCSRFRWPKACGDDMGPITRSAPASLRPRVGRHLLMTAHFLLHPHPMISSQPYLNEATNEKVFALSSRVIPFSPITLTGTIHRKFCDKRKRIRLTIGIWRRWALSRAGDAWRHTRITVCRRRACLALPKTAS